MSDLLLCLFLGDFQVTYGVDAVKTDVGAAKPTLSPFAKNKNLIELKVFFLVILHLDLCPGKVWEFSIFFILHTSRRNFWIAALKEVSVRRGSTVLETIMGKYQ